MLWDILFQHIKMSGFNSHILFHFENIFFLNFIVHPGNSTELKPPIIVLIITEFSQNQVNCVSVLWKNYIMRNAQFNQLIGNKTKYKRQRVSNFWSFIILSKRTQGQSVTHWWVDFLYLNAHAIQVNFLWRIW